MEQRQINCFLRCNTWDLNNRDVPGAYLSGLCCISIFFFCCCCEQLLLFLWATWRTESISGKAHSLINSFRPVISACVLRIVNLCEPNARDGKSTFTYILYFSRSMNRKILWGKGEVLILLFTWVKVKHKEVKSADISAAADNMSC